MDEQERKNWYSTQPQSGGPEPSCNLRAARRSYSRVGWSLTVLLAATAFMQLVAMLVIQTFFPELTASPWYVWLLSMLPMYVVGLPLCLLCMGGMERVAPEKAHMSLKGFFICLVMSLGLMYALNLATNLLLMLFGELTGAELINPLEEVVGQSELPQTVLFAVIIAPVLEELVFRKLLIDRLLRYGERGAILASGILFGLYHGNLSQAFYACGLGLLFAFIYVRTGRVRNTILLHMCVNFFGSVPAMLLLERIDPRLLEGMAVLDPALIQELLPQVLLYGVYVAFMLGVTLAGILLLANRACGFRPRSLPTDIPAGQRFRTGCLNSGIIVYTLLALSVFALSILAPSLL